MSNHITAVVQTFSGSSPVGRAGRRRRSSGVRAMDMSGLLALVDDQLHHGNGHKNEHENEGGSTCIADLCPLETRLVDVLNDEVVLGARAAAVERLKQRVLLHRVQGGQQDDDE